MQAVGALHIVTPSIKFNNNGSVAALNQPLGDDGGDAGNAQLRAQHVLLDADHQGALLRARRQRAVRPRHLSTATAGIGRYQGIKSDLKTINVKPALAWKIDDAWSVGVGVNWQRIEATLTQATNYSAALAAGAQAAAAAGAIPASLVPQIIAATPGLDGNAKIDGDDSAWGWNIGVLYNINAKQRIGAHYRSSIKYNVDGNVELRQRRSRRCRRPSRRSSRRSVGSIASAVNASSTFANGGVTLANRAAGHPPTSRTSARWTTSGT